MLFSLSMFPIGASDSLVGPVGEVIEEIDRAGLAYQVTGMDTVIEGGWDEVMPVIHSAQQRLRAKHKRVFMMMAIDDHEAVEGRLRESVRDVEQQLGHAVSH